MSSKTEKMKQVRDEVLSLTESPLYEYRVKNNYYPVIGAGNHDASIMFIGEAPGKNEAEQAKPFCGAAGRVLDELLVSIEVARSDVYITNIVKDRPPENRDPTPEEITIYAPFLDRQIEIIEPKVIATLGRFSMEYIMKRYGLEAECGSISLIHGKQFSVTMPFGEIVVIPLFHPAMALYKGDMKQTLLVDFQTLKKVAGL